MIIMLIIITAIVIYMEVPALVKNKYWKELITFSILIFTGLILNLLLIIGVKIPSPALFIEENVNEFVNFIFS